MYDAILIDADNTLFDFDETQALSITECLSYFDLPAHEEAIDHYNELNRLAWQQYNRGRIENEEINLHRWRPWLAKFDPDQRVVPEALAGRYADNLAQQCEKEPGAERLMQYLFKHWPVHIITNGFSSTQKYRWHNAGWHDQLHGITVSAEVGAKKPHPDIFHVAMQALGLADASRCLMIGDTLESDVEGGQAVGMQTCWYQRKGATNTTNLQPDITVSHLDELTHYLLEKMATA